MRTNQMLVIGAVTVVALAGLALSQDKSSPSTRPTLASPHETRSPALSGSPEATTDFPVIGYLEKRGRSITVKAGPKGPLYSVRTAEGTVLCENLSKEQVSAQAPELGEFLKGAMAGRSGAKTDARVRVMMDARMR
jgi:hypothetical protein